MKMRLSMVATVVLLACGNGVTPVTPTDAGFDAGSSGDAGVDAGQLASYFGVFHLEGALDAGVLVPTTSVANYEFRSDGLFRYVRHDCLSSSSAGGMWSWSGSELTVPSDDKPGKPPYVIALVAGSSAVTIHLQGSTDFTRWQPGGLCSRGCDGGVEVTQSCTDPF